VWLDSHCHLAAGEFDLDRAAVLDRAREAGVDAFIAIGSGYGIAGNARAVEMAQLGGMRDSPMQDQALAYIAERQSKR